MKRIVTAVLATLFAVTGLAATQGAASADVMAPPALAAPATAQVANVDEWAACQPPSTCTNGARGTITWYNRTAQVSGSVWNQGAGFSQIAFRAFAGSTQIGAQESRTADDTGSVGSPRGFSFSMGDTNLQGGINRIYFRFCAPSLSNCSAWHRVDK